MRNMLEMEMKRLKLALVFLATGLFAFFSQSSLATYPDITGPWSGNGFEFGANYNAAKGTAGVTATISEQQDGQFNIKISLGGMTLVSGEQSLFTDIIKVMGVTPSGTGQFTGMSSISFTLDSIDGTQTLAGTADLVNNNQSHVTLTGYLTTPTMNWLNVTGDGYLNRSVNLVNPVTSQPSEVVFDVNELSQTVFGWTSMLTGRTAGLRGGHSPGGLALTGTGITLSTPTGLAAGDTFTNLGVWAGYTRSDFDNDFVRTRYDGDRNSVMVGADFAPADNMVLGVAIGYEQTDIETEYNLGEVDSDGWTVAPYFGMVFNDTWSMDVNGGYSFVDTDQFRTAGGTRITSDLDTSRWFVAANVNGFTAIDNWLLTGRLGLVRAESDDDGYTELNTATGVPGVTFDDRSTSLTQLSVGGEVAYSFGEFEPYVSLTYNHDASFTKTRLTAGLQPANDNNDFLFGGGFNYFSDTNGLSASASYHRRLSREEFDEGIFSVSARWDF